MKRSGLFLYSILVLLVFMSGCRVEPESEAAPAVEIPDALVLTPSAVALPTLATETPGSIASEVAQPTPSIPTSAGVLGERSIGDAYIPELGNTGYDVQQYTLRLALDPQRVYLDAHVTVEAIASIEQIAQISLDFIGYEIEEVSMGGAPVVFSREERKLVVDLPEPLSEGQLFALDIIYRGEPVFEASPFVPFISHLGLQFPEPEQSGGVYAVSEPDGARYWFPCNDHPRDKATFRFELGVPEEVVRRSQRRPDRKPAGRTGSLRGWFPWRCYHLGAQLPHGDLPGDRRGGRLSTPGRHLPGRSPIETLCVSRTGQPV
jgi:hypothetical protein